MWTRENRVEYNRGHLRYPSDSPVAITERKIDRSAFNQLLGDQWDALAGAYFGSCVR